MVIKGLTSSDDAFWLPNVGVIFSEPRANRIVRLDEHDQPVPGEPRTRFAHPCKAESMFCGRRADARMIRTRSR